MRLRYRYTPDSQYEQMLADRPPVLTSQFIRYMLGASAEQIGELVDDTPSPLSEPLSPLSPQPRFSLFTSSINHARRLFSYVFNSSYESPPAVLEMQNVVAQENLDLPRMRYIPYPGHPAVNYIILPPRYADQTVYWPTVRPVTHSHPVSELPINANSRYLEELKFPAYSVPRYMLCAISFQIMCEPVFTVGMSGEVIAFDYESIKRYLVTSKVHPFTKLPLTKDDLIYYPRMLASINRFLTHATPENSAVCLQRFFRARREYKQLRDTRLANMTDDQKIAYKNGLKLFQIAGMDKEQLNGLRIGLTQQEVSHPNYTGSIADLVEQGFNFKDVIGLNEKQQARALHEYEMLLAKSKLVPRYSAVVKAGLSKEQLRHPNFNATVAQLVEHGFKFNYAIQLTPPQQQLALQNYEQILNTPRPRPR